MRIAACCSAVSPERHVEPGRQAVRRSPPLGGRPVGPRTPLRERHPARRAGGLDPHALIHDPVPRRGPGAYLSRRRFSRACQNRSSEDSGGRLSEPLRRFRHSPSVLSTPWTEKPALAALRAAWGGPHGIRGAYPSSRYSAISAPVEAGGGDPPSLRTPSPRFSPDVGAGPEGNIGAPRRSCEYPIIKN